MFCTFSSVSIPGGNKRLLDYYVYACSPLDFVLTGGLIHLIRLITLCTVHIIYVLCYCLPVLTASVLNQK